MESYSTMIVLVLYSRFVPKRAVCAGSTVNSTRFTLATRDGSFSSMSKTQIPKTLIKTTISKLMAIRFLVLQNKQGRTRLSKWYTNERDSERVEVEREIYRTIIMRDNRQTNIIEMTDFKVVYKRYASLYFIMGIDSDENELAMMEVV